MPNLFVPDNTIETQFPDNESVSFDLEAFDDFIRSQGVKLVHYRAMRCPVGLTDMYDSRRPHDDHMGCSNGFLYVEAGPVTGAFSGNSNQQNHMDMGIVDQAQSNVTFPRVYDDGVTEFTCVQFDRFYLNEPSISIVNWQLISAHALGVERLHYPAVSVEQIVDSQGHFYKSTDFTLTKEGEVKWLHNRPQAGTVLSIRYRYRPFWYCKHLIHEIRVTQGDDRISGKRALRRMPMQVTLQREVFFENEDKDPESIKPRSLRQTEGPEDGGYGPR